MSDLISSKDKHSLESDTDVSESFLVLVVDLSTLAWAKFSEYSFKSPLRNGVESAPVNGESKSTVLTNVLDALLVFCNAFVALQVSSKLAVIGCNAHESTIIYPNDGTHNISITRAGGQMPTFVEITENIKIGVREMARREAALVQSGDLDAEQESLLAGGICRAACLAKSMEESLMPGQSLKSRCFLLSASGHTTSQYLGFMGSFFCLQKLNTPLDVLTFGVDSGVLQQGADITGGLYFNLQQVDGVLQFLLWLFLPDPSVRDLLAVAEPKPVDYRAACFCHRQLISSGFVCSVCLSIFCRYSPICSTCHSVFKILGPPPGGRRKKPHHSATSAATHRL